MAAGNVKAIGDWFKSRTYGKNAIEDFFLKISEGLTAYDITILYGEHNGTATIEGQTSEKSYNVCLDENGRSVHNLLFFTSGEDIVVTSGSLSKQITLTDRVVSISLISYSETVLWDYVTDNSGTIDYNGTAAHTMHDSIDNYDYISLELFSFANDLNPGQWQCSLIHFGYFVDVLNDNPVAGNVIIWSFDTRASHFIFSGDTFRKHDHQTTTNINGIVKIVGVVKPHSKQTLWHMTTDNNNQTLGGLFTITLHDSIDNYDELVIVLESYVSDLVSADWACKNIHTVSVDALKNAKNNNRTALVSYDDRSSVFYASGTTFQKIYDQTGQINKLIAVYGIKY